MSIQNHNAADYFPALTLLYCISIDTDIVIIYNDLIH